MSDEPTSSHYAAIDGLQMYYELHGSGDPLVLIHGGGLTIDLSFAELLPALAARRHVIAVELQGHGHTADTSRDITIANLASDVAALLVQLGIERADVLGFSLGGLVTLELAINHPGRVGRAVVASAHYRPDGYHQEILDPGLWATSTRMPTAQDFEQMKTTYAAVAPDPEHFDAFMTKTSSAAQTFEGWSDEDLRSVSAPVLLVVGDHDFVLIEHAATMLELIPDAQLAVLPGTTHNQVTHRADLIVPMLASFLP